MLALLVSLCAVFAAFPPSAPDAKLLASKLESRYRPAHTLQATFLERYSENSQVVRSEAGEVYFLRPGKMRWQYESPEKNLFLVDGKTAWFYVPADRTVTKAPAKQSTDWRTPLALLAGKMKLSRICARVELATTLKPATSGNQVLYCPPRGESNDSSDSSSSPHPANPSESAHSSDSGPDESIYLEISPSTGDLARVLIREKGGVDVEFKFADWRFDPPLAASFFRFQVPPGVAIVNPGSLADARP